MVDHNLKSLGWSANLENSFKELSGEYEPGRISARHKNNYRLLTAGGEVIATISGNMHHRKDYPAVGDWVAISIWEDSNKATIHWILPRKTTVSRKAPGKKTQEQVIAANIDTIFIVTSLNKEFNPKRIERYLAIIQESGARPVIVLNKADLCTDIAEKMQKLEGISQGVPTHIVSALENRGIKELTPYMEEGQTVALLGSSGVGKSTLINAMTGEETLKVQDVRPSDDRGRHTTTHRELYLIEGGGMVIDNPGMREIQLINVDEGIRGTFSDIEEFASRCKFKDCRHLGEPHCAVKEALEAGHLSPERMENYNKLKREVRYVNLKDSLPSSRAVDKVKWDHIIKEANQEDGFDHLQRAAYKRKLKNAENPK